MNSKIIAAGVVVALCAVALIGVGYAYTATVTSSGNAFSANYILVQVGDNAETMFTGEEIEYKTETKAESVVDYTSVPGSWESKENIVVTNPNELNVQTVSIIVSIKKSDLSITGDATVIGGDYSGLFDNANASILANGESSKNGSYDASGDSITWSFSGVSFNKEYKLTLHYVEESFIGTLTKAPSDLTIPITVEVTATPVSAE